MEASCSLGVTFAPTWPARSRHTHTHSRAAQALQPVHSVRPPGCTPHALPEFAVLLEAVPPTPPLSSFEPQFSPAIAVAAALAAVPPILFWYRVASNAIKFQKDIDDKEAARLKLLDKLTGRSRDE